MVCGVGAAIDEIEPVERSAVEATPEHRHDEQSAIGQPLCWGFGQPFELPGWSSLVAVDFGTEQEGPSSSFCHAVN